MASATQGVNILSLTRSNINSKKTNQQGYRSRYSALGLDMGSAAIKVIQLRHHRGEEQCHLKAVMPTPRGSITNGKLVKPDLMAARLEQLKQNHQLHKDNVNLCLSLRACHLTQVSMPEMHPKELNKAMRWEMKKHFTLEPEEAVYDYCLLSSSNKNTRGSRKKSSVYLLAATLKETADSYTDAVYKSGFYPVSLEIQPLALLRSLNHRSRISRSKNTMSEIVVNIGFQTATLVTNCRKGFLLIRNINSGIADFCRAASDGSGCSLNEAHRQLFRKKKPFFKSLILSAEHLADQLARSLSYWIDHYSLEETSFQKMLLDGGGALIPWLPDFLAERLSIPVEIHEPLPDCNSNNRSNNLTDPLFSTAYGLALRGWLK